MAETFVLVHGAWHGAWCWAAVMRQLELGGDRAFALDLPGRGSHPMDHAKITREVWVDAVVRFIEDHGLRDVVLAGHSLGGLTITGVGLSIPNRIKRLIYVTALVPPEQASILDDIVPNLSAEARDSMEMLEGGVSSMLSAARFRSHFIQDGSRDLQDFVLAALRPEAMIPWSQPVPMRDFYALNIPTSYVACEDDLVMDDPRAWHPGLSSRLRNPTMRSIKAGHELMFTRPVECARALAELARE
ncbi:MAG TPA: alpha/beta fold hydrolase [Candidatus Binataceae bacterium]|nr:alpha/beta fold hydrolase [Candidatus Binataceae bacterium]